MEKETKIFCSSCSSTEIVKHGKKDGVQRYRCTGTRLKKKLFYQCC